MILLLARKLNSRFNMMTIHEVSLNGPKVFPIRHLLILQVETLPYRREILRWDSLRSRWIPVSEGSWNSYSLPDNFAEPSATGNTNSPSFGVIRTSFAFSLLGYVSDASNFSNSSISEVRISSSQIPPANKACPRRIPQIFVHFEMSRLPGSLGHLADSNSIP